MDKREIEKAIRNYEIKLKDAEKRGFVDAVKENTAALNFYKKMLENFGG